MKRIKKIITSSIAALSLAIMIPTGANAEWRHDGNGWWYSQGNSYLKDCYQYINDDIYFFDSNGYLKTGWVQSEFGNWYYYYSDGTLAKNTVINGYVLAQKGNYLEGVTQEDVNKYRKIMRDNIVPEILNENYFVESNVSVVKNWGSAGHNLNINRAIVFSMQDTDYEYDPQMCAVDMDTNKVYYFTTGFDLGICENHNITMYEYNWEKNK